MKTTNFRDLPISYNKKYTMTINKLYRLSMVVSINGRRFYISIPKNSSWIHVTLYEGLVCTVIKEQYFSGEREYAKLTFIESNENTYYEKENNYKEAAMYSSFTKYYEVLECSIDASLLTIKKNYKTLIRQYHYDTLASKDLPKDINEAYQILKRLNT
ncbi:MAG: hypothetical protein CL623_05905 [Arcobacter sp.]|nr:hypothetical protein [Arcobacter sp.]